MEEQNTTNEQPASGRSSTTTVILIIGGLVVFALCLMPVLVICFLTLLGPQIGDVFSQITGTLGATPLP